MLRVGSLFSGVGGFDLGFLQAGFDIRWQCEIDERCCEVLGERFPETGELYGDIRDVNWAGVSPVDVIIGGFPCQDVSVAGRRAGLAGERSSLFHEFVRVVSIVCPTIVVIENVPGLLSSNGGRDMAVVLGSLRDVGATDVAWRVLDAQFYGVPQRRRRIFIAADFAGERAAEILALTQGLSGDHPPRRAQGKDAPRGPGSRPDPDGRILHALTARYGHGPNTTLDDPLVAGTIGGGKSGERGWRNDLDTSGAFVTHTLHNGQRGVSEDGTGHGIPVIAHALTAEGADAMGGPDVGTPLVVTYDARNDDVSDDATMTLQSKKSGGWSLGYQPVVATLTAPAGGGRRDKNIVSVRTAQTSSNGWSVNEDETSYTLDGASGQAVAITENMRGEVRGAEVTNALASGGGKPGQGYAAVAFNWQNAGHEGYAVTEDGTGPLDTSQTKAVAIPDVASPLIDSSGERGYSTTVDSPNWIPQPMGVRRLTPTECERLMGWPDDHTKYGIDGRVLSDSVRYRMCGNGVVAPVARWIAERILRCLSS